MQVATLATKILKMSPSIRYVTVESLGGKLLYSAHKRTVKTNTCQEQKVDNHFKLQQKPGR